MGLRLREPDMAALLPVGSSIGACTGNDLISGRTSATVNAEGVSKGGSASWG